MTLNREQTAQKRIAEIEQRPSLLRQQEPDWRERIEKEVAAEALAAATPPLGFAECASQREMYNLLMMAQAEGAFVIIMGGAGVGKTTVLRRYAAEYRRVHLVTYTDYTGTPRRAVAHAHASIIGDSTPRGYSQFLQISTALRHRDEPRALLICDEMQSTEDSVWNELRQFRDHADCGLAFVGNDFFEARWNRAKKEHRQRMDAIISRADAVLVVKSSRADDIEDFCRHCNIVGKEAQSILEDQAKKFGNLRAVERIVIRAHETAGSRPLTAQDIAQAIRSIHR